MSLSPRLLLLSCLALSGCARQSSGPLFLVIDGAFPTFQQVAERAAARQAEIVMADDCAPSAPAPFLIVLHRGGSRREAETALERQRGAAPSATVIECAVRPGSRLDYGLPAIEPSIFRVPRDAVNWTDRDRVSTLHPLANGEAIWIRRIYQQSEPGDPREGRREQLHFLSSRGTPPKLLAADCSDPAWDRRGPWLAISCASETAGDHWLHRTSLIDLKTGKTARIVNRCREPKLGDDIACRAESVSAEGELVLTPKRVPLPTP